MRVVAALGGNALLRRGQPPHVSVQRTNVAVAAAAIADLAADHDVIVTHGKVHRSPCSRCRAWRRCRPNRRRSTSSTPRTRV